MLNLECKSCCFKTAHGWTQFRISLFKFLQIQCQNSYFVACMHTCVIATYFENFSVALIKLIIWQMFFHIVNKFGNIRQYTNTRTSEIHEIITTILKILQVTSRNFTVLDASSRTNTLNHWRHWHTIDNNNYLSKQISYLRFWK